MSTKTITLTIDGEEVTVPEGTTVLRAAALNGIHIPKLCATDTLEPFGSCRLCLVEIEGVRGTPASCTTPVAEGMQVLGADLKNGLLCIDLARPEPERVIQKINIAVRD